MTKKTFFDKFSSTLYPHMLIYNQFNKSSLLLAILTLYSFSIFSQKSNPNILFILADDLGAYDLSYAGSKFYETPNIDAISREGVQFINGYAAAQVCSPSRASIMSGQYTVRHGITDWIGAATGEEWGDYYNTKVMPPEYSYHLSEDNKTIADVLKQNGYKTFFAGKWHLGNKPYSPENHGFEINKGGWEVGGPKGGYYAPWRNPKLDYKYEGENLTQRLALETAEFIEEYQDEPFFAFLSFYAVHGPIETTEAKWKKYREKAEELGISESGFELEAKLPFRKVQDNPIYAGLVESMDDAVGVVLDKLKELGLEGNTIVVFTSDNGGVVSGDAFSTSNYPLRGGKGYQWEGGIREPYLIKAPMIKNAPKQIDYPVSGIDFYPTLLDLVGVKNDSSHIVDGVSLVPLLKGETLKERPLFWHYPHYGNQGGDPVSIIRRGAYKLIHYWEDGHDELYNLSADPGESEDIAKEKPEITKNLRSQLDIYLERTNARVPENYPKYDLVKAKAKIEQQKTIILKRLEKQRKDFLSKDFNPNNNWYDSSLNTKD